MVWPGVADHIPGYSLAVFTTGQQTLYQNIIIMAFSLTTNIGRLRVIALLEGVSLLVLTGIAVPLKYIRHDPSLVKSMGPIHGLLFLFFVFLTISVGIEQQWRFRHTTWKVLLACIIPFGTFYIDKTILSKIKTEDRQER